MQRLTFGAKALIETSVRNLKRNFGLRGRGTPGPCHKATDPACSDDTQPGRSSRSILVAITTCSKPQGQAPSQKFLRKPEKAQFGAPSPECRAQCLNTQAVMGLPLPRWPCRPGRASAGRTSQRGMLHLKGAPDSGTETEGAPQGLELRSSTPGGMNVLPGGILNLYQMWVLGSTTRIKNQVHGPSDQSSRWPKLSGFDTS